MKKKLVAKRKDELPSINRTFSADDIALVRKFFKKKVENAPAKYKVDKNSKNETCLVPDESDLTFHYAKLFRAFGTSSVALQVHFTNQLTSTFSGSTSKADSEKIVSACNTAIAIIDEIRPRDVIEGMLITQMIGVHNMAMKTLGRAMLAEQTFTGKEANVYQATKMLRTFTQQMDSLKNYRQKGQQKVTVEHVNVNNGGQAIVGLVTKGGEG